ncbi:MAG: DUF808 domain-containing protein [Gemmatimonadota bacterium]
MATSLLALLDDITTMLDDVAVLTKMAATKTSAVMGDDLALNAEQVSGVSAQRELPVVWAVAKGSFINKLILVPAALAISAFFPAAIIPLMMIGGLFLCYEGVEKVLHKLTHSEEDSPEHKAEVSAAVRDPKVDLVAFEKDKIKGAVRTDFILSAEIIVISLGTVAAASLGQRVLVLSAIGIGATVLVYGLVAGIVKLDDAGRSLIKRRDAFRRKLGAGILTAAPILMKCLSILGTVAMFTVGGSILVHGIPAVEHLIEGITTPVKATNGFLGTVLTSVLDAVFGIICGAITLGVVLLVKRMFGGSKKVAAAHP